MAISARGRGPERNAEGLIQFWAAAGGDDAKGDERERETALKTSRTNWRRVRALRDRDIKVDRAHPELDRKHVVQHVVRQGLKMRPPKKSR